MVRVRLLTLPLVVFVACGAACGSGASGSPDAAVLVSVDGGGMPRGKTEATSLANHYLAAVTNGPKGAGVLTLDSSSTGGFSISYGSPASTLATGTEPYPPPNSVFATPTDFQELVPSTSQYTALFSWAALGDDAPLDFLNVGVAGTTVTVHGGQIVPDIRDYAPLAVSPDGTQVAFESCPGGTCQVERAGVSTTPGVVQLGVDPGQIGTPLAEYTFLADGTLVLVRPDATAGTVDASGAFTAFAGVPPVAPNGILSAGNAAVFCTTAGKLLAVTGKGVATMLATGVDPTQPVELSVSGTNLLYASTNGVFEVPLAGGTPPLRLASGLINALSPSGRYLLTTDSTTTVLTDLQPSPPTGVSLPCQNQGFTFGPGDKFLLFLQTCSTSAPSPSWTALDLATGTSVTLQALGASGPDFWPAFVEPGLAIVAVEASGTWSAWVDDLTKDTAVLFDTDVTQVFALPGQTDGVVYQTGDANFGSHIYWASAR
jgi:hypothetical protein